MKIKARTSFYILLSACWVFSSAQIQTAKASSARISQAQCEANQFDHREYFSAEGDQGAQGQCFAFTAKGLLEEHLCRSQKKCGLSLSAIDLARDYPHKVGRRGDVIVRDYFNLSNSNQGGLEFEILEAALQFGVCDEQYAPWFPKLEKACQGMEDRSGCVLSALKRIWKKHEKATAKYLEDPDSGCWVRADGSPLKSKEQDKLDALMESLEELLAPQLDQELDLQGALRAARSEFEFVKLVLTPESCIQNRRMFSSAIGQSVPRMWKVEFFIQSPEWGETENESRYTNLERLEKITDGAREHQRSVALGLCWKAAQSKSLGRRDDPRQGETCGPHALIASGVRWNRDKSRCEIHIRNSWGADTSLRDWLPIEPVLNSTFRISGIAPGG